MGRATRRSRQGPEGKEGQSPRAIWAEGGAGGGVVPARGVGLPFNSNLQLPSAPKAEEGKVSAVWEAPRKSRKHQHASSGGRTP